MTPKQRNQSDCKEIEFYFPIEAKPKQSVRGGRDKNGKAVFYKDSKVKNYENELIVLANPQVKGRFLNGAILYVATYIFEVPKSYPKWVKDAVNNGQKVIKETKPDLTDNLNKVIIDAISPLIMGNDSQIGRCIVEKVYGLKSCIKCKFIELPNPID